MRDSWQSVFAAAYFFAVAVAMTWPQADSGDYPPSYLDVVHACTTWNTACVAALRGRGVTAIAMHVSDRSDESSITVGMLEADLTLEPVLTAQATWDLVRVYRWRSGH